MVLRTALSNLASPRFGVSEDPFQKITSIVRSQFFRGFFFPVFQGNQIRASEMLCFRRSYDEWISGFWKKRWALERVDSDSALLKLFECSQIMNHVYITSW